MTTTDSLKNVNTALIAAEVPDSIRKKVEQDLKAAKNKCGRQPEKQARNLAMRVIDDLRKEEIYPEKDLAILILHYATEYLSAPTSPKR